MRVTGSPARRPRRLVAAVVLIGALGVVGGSAARAQPTVNAPSGASTATAAAAEPGEPAPPAPASASGRAPFPADRVAMMPAEGGPGMPPVGPIPPPLALSDFYVASGTDPGSPEVVLRFAEPFALPRDGYRLSVIVGDPVGPRLATSLLAGQPPAAHVPTSEVARYDGTAWEKLPPAAVQFDDLGFALITLPLGLAPPGDAIWVEISLGSPLEPQRLSPFFSRRALLDPVTAGQLPGDALGVPRERRGRPDQRAVVLGEPPTVAVRGGAAIVETGILPIQVVNQPVIGIVDVVRIIDSYNRNGHSAEVRLDRGKGTISLFDTSSDPPQDRTGDLTWVRRTTSPGGSGAGVVPSGSAESIELDLAGLGRTLGIDTVPALTALGVRRIVTLADGEAMTAEGVLATVASLALNAVPEIEVAAARPSPATVPPPESGAAGLWLFLAALAAVVVVTVWVRRRRAAAPAAAAPPGRQGPDRVPWGDGDAAITAPVPQTLASAERPGRPRVAGHGGRRVRRTGEGRARGSEARSSRTRPPGGPAPERRSSRPPATPPAPVPPERPVTLPRRDPAPLADPVGPGPSAELKPSEPAPPAAPAGPVQGPAPGAVGPDDVLAALDGEMSELSNRIDDL
jgi:hypothetical protein